MTAPHAEQDSLVPQPPGRVDAGQHLTRAPRQDGARVLRSDHLEELSVGQDDLTPGVEDDGRPQHGIEHDQRERVGDEDLALLPDRARVAPFRRCEGARER